MFIKVVRKLKVVRCCDCNEYTYMLSIIRYCIVLLGNTYLDQGDFELVLSDNGIYLMVLVVVQRRVQTLVLVFVFLLYEEVLLEVE